jgi:hypothetical protein
MARQEQEPCEVVVLSLAGSRPARLPALELLLGARAGKFPVAPKPGHDLSAAAEHRMSLAVRHLTTIGCQASGPWHLSATQTALSFTRGYLGFSVVNLVTGATVRAGDARVAVGFPIMAGRTSTAAVIHLVRFGTGPLAPWEVVGTDDTDFSLTSPRTAASPRPR